MLKKVKKILFVLVIFLSLPVSVYLALERTSFFKSAYTEITGVRANLIVNLTTPNLVSYYPWSFLAQGGEEQKDMLGPVLPKIKALEPEYIRIDHIYDFYDLVVKDEQGKILFSWDKLDEQILNIVNVGAKPFLSLSPIPPLISSRGPLEYPDNWNEWEYVVQKTVEHISGKNNLGLEDVYYEVWNEPDLFGGFKIGSQKDYLTLYYHTHQGVVGADDTLAYKIGGPATTNLYKNWFDGFFEFAQKEGLRVDFYSWHKYTKDTHDYFKDVNKIRSWIKKYDNYKNVELIISEAGITSEIDPVNDSGKSAIHALSMYSKLFNEDVKIFSFEIKDGPGSSAYWGRWGLLTHEKFGPSQEKPRYKAIQMLNTLKGNWYPVDGQGTWVSAIAADNGRGINLVVVNYDQFDKHTENVPITFVGLPYNNFKLVKTKFLGEPIGSEVSISGNNFSTYQMMEPNSAYLIQIIPLEE